jgi:hypothetical protein
MNLITVKMITSNHVTKLLIGYELIWYGIFAAPYENN